MKPQLRKAWFLMFALIGLHGQANAQAVCTVGQVPTQVLDAIRAAPTGAIYSVDREIRYPGKILKAEQIVFEPNGTLILTALNQSGPDAFIAIVAKKIKFTDPRVRSAIVRDPTIRASAGSPGSGGANTPGQAGRAQAGAPGGNGSNGSPGGTVQLPKIYIIAGSLESPTNTELSSVKLLLGFSGIEGGNGGNGGRGGRGQTGGSGTDGRSGPFGCEAGPGSGANGGSGGSGGNGGAGGRGGDGGTIFFVGPKPVTDTLSFAAIQKAGGFGGRSGMAGRGGPGGAGGPRGSSPGLCNAGGRGPGEPGSYGVDGREGTEGAEGNEPQYAYCANNVNIASLF